MLKKLIIGVIAPAVVSVLFGAFTTGCAIADPGCNGPYRDKPDLGSQPPPEPRANFWCSVPFQGTKDGYTKSRMEANYIIRNTTASHAPGDAYALALRDSAAKVDV